MNETLEEIAGALFKSWFVDFDPVRAKTAGCGPAMSDSLMALFPSTLEETELGLAPKGWRVVTLGTICQRIAMGPFGSDIKTDNFIDSGVPVIRGANLKNGFVDRGFVYISNDKADELRTANAYPDDIVITHRGTLGQVGMIPQGSSFPRYVVSQSQMVLSVDPAIVKPRFVFEFLRSAGGQQQLLSNTSQTGVPAIARPVTSMKAMRLIVPSLALLEKFETLIQSLAVKVVANGHESSTLVTLREALLLKLMAGEIANRASRKDD
jgi:type I restriction enzyme S subunit